jgi:hypothetical protein
VDVPRHRRIALACAHQQHCRPDVIDWIGVAALAWWAVDEVLRGVNPWRRFLGLAGCVFALAGLIALLVH